MPGGSPVAFSSDTKYGLRHPAAASALERALHPAGRCPNSNFLFPPQAAVVAVAGHSIARPIAALRQQGPTPADGPQRNSRPAARVVALYASLLESDYIIVLFHKKIKTFFVVSFFQKTLDRSFTACYNKLLSEQTSRTAIATPRLLCTLGSVIAGPLSPKGGATKWQSTKPC